MNTARKYDILEASWNSDPFKTKGFVTGVTPLTPESQLSDYAQSLVINYSTYCFDQYELSLDKVPEDEQYNLARLYIEFTGRELTECVNGDDFAIDNEYSCALLAMLHHNNPETREAFAQVTQRNILIYYKQSLQDVLDEACHDYLQNVTNEQSYYAHTDEHGNVQWGTGS